MQKRTIAVIGFGKMGREIKEMAIGQGHEVAMVIDSESDWSAIGEELSLVEVAIEFTTPQQAPKNIARCFHAGVPIVCGTTGWYEQLPALTELCRDLDQTLFYAPNFSVGVNILFEINRSLARIMAVQPHYKPGISETHHIHKLDAPSGTAAMLANDIVNIRTDINSWTINTTEAGNDQLPIEVNRIEDVPGTHEVSYHSATDTISISHIAHGRKGFSQGALLAACWVYNKKGIFTMHDLLKF